MSDDAELAAIRHRIANPANRWANEIQKDAEVLLRRLDIATGRVAPLYSLEILDLAERNRRLLDFPQSQPEAKP